MWRRTHARTKIRQGEKNEEKNTSQETLFCAQRKGRLQKIRLLRELPKVEIKSVKNSRQLKGWTRFQVPTLQSVY